jgi:hypothetical protein
MYHAICEYCIVYQNVCTTRIVYQNEQQETELKSVPCYIEHSVSECRCDKHNVAE